jgi:hypothetical protein
MCVSVIYVEEDKQMVAIITLLVKEGVTFEATQLDVTRGWRIELTGGY